MSPVLNEFTALCERAGREQQQGDFAAAVASYTSALQQRPQSAAALTNRSNALRALARLPEALADLDAALRIRPAFPEALNNRGNVLRDMGRLQEALESFEQALMQRADFAMALCNRGNALLDLARPGDAFDSFELALRLNPNDPEALFGQASARLRLGRDLALAAEQFEHSAAYGIARSEALVGRAAALAAQDRHAQAASCIEELLGLEPEWEYARGSLVYSRLKACEWRDLDGLASQLCGRVAQGERASYAHSLLAVTDSPDLLLRCARTAVAHRYSRIAAAARPSSQPSARPARARRLRIAYISADFGDHPVAQSLIGVLERHDRERFEIIGVDLCGRHRSPFAERVRGAFDAWVDAASLTEEATAARLRDAEVDVAVDLMGHTEGMRLGLFVHRAAPVQVNYLGYAGSCGASCLDYILADPVVIPIGAQSGYSEQVVRLPHCFLPTDDRRPVSPAPTRAAVGLPEQGFVFCAFTAPQKIMPAVFGVWMRLLRAVPDSVLWLRATEETARGNLLREAAARGVDPDRLVFAVHVARSCEHLARHSLADLYLDTFPYNAHSTACDSLWAGVPVLTCAGHGFASRVAASALHAVGLPELITADLDQYAALARQLARERARLDALRSRLHRASPRSPLFDTARYTGELETAFERMHQRAVAGLAPQAFDLPPGGPAQGTGP
jgi:protein O-GlcNAc transferase